MRPLAMVLFAGLVLANGLSAQKAPAAPTDPAGMERALAARATTLLIGIADALAAEKQHGRALALRLEVLKEYDQDHATAREHCGYVKVSGIWRRDDNKVVFEKDAKGNAKVIQKIEKDLAAAIKELTAGHQKIAEAATAAADVTLATRHWQRLLRFRPGDAKALLALQRHDFDGFSGAPDDLAMLQRARGIRLAVDWLRRREFAVSKLADKCPILTKAEVQHHAVRSEHFTVHGNLPEGQMVLFAQYCERSLALCRTLFGTAGGAVFSPVLVRNVLLASDRATYQKIIDACADQFDQSRLAFLRNDVALSFLDRGEERVRLYLVDGDEVLVDLAVRGVIQDATMFEHGLWEGVGHAACGFFFDQTLTFLVEQQQGHTVTEWKPKPLLPDMETWRQIAAESAWARSDTPTSQLVLIHASKFDNEQRVKAWAIADYLFRTRPELLFELNQSRTDKIKTPPEIEGEFLRRTQMELPKLDADWRTFWTRGEALRAAMVAEPAGSKDEVAAARAVADAINEARYVAGRGPLGFHVSHHDDAAAVHRYHALRLRAEAELKKNPKAKVTMPEVPAGIGVTVMAYAGTDPVAAVANWLLQPGARDRLLHPGRQLVGVSPGKQALVVEFSLPQQATTRGAPLCWPAHGQREVATEARIADLGTALGVHFAGKGRPNAELVGMPLSLHFHRELSADDIRQVSCQVFAGGVELAGELLCVQGDAAMAVAAPGCFLFVPDRPLPAGAEVTVAWTVPKGVLPKGESFPRVVFLTH
ncbi:MAG: hypothetical protein IPK26_28205 [Planctomycetes bacterium]|nr:hypothetical protein [Planctomycetota bacterium]